MMEPKKYSTVGESTGIPRLGRNRQTMRWSQFKNLMMGGGVALVVEGSAFGFITDGEARG
jgi:hypothetical protein